MLSMSIERRASVCAVTTAFSIANVLAAVADSAAEASSSFNELGNAKIRTAKIWSLLLGCGGALAVSLLRTLVPELQPLLETSANRSATKPRIVALNRIDLRLGTRVQ
jgi:hypothetical protein